MSRNLTHDGEVYTWSGERWYEARTFLTPSLKVQHALNVLLLKALTSEDQVISDINVLLGRARGARKARQLMRAECLARRVLTSCRLHVGAAAVLSSVLRARNKPEEALAVTETLSSSNYVPLITSRAAALCDLGYWEEAMAEVNRALLYGGSEETQLVAERIHYFSDRDGGG